MTTFFSIIVIVFAILQIILFFKLWGMANDVSKIKGRLSNSEYTFKKYMLLGEKEKAFNLLKETLTNRLMEWRKNLLTAELFVKNVTFIDIYVKKAELTGFELPEHLKTAQAFWDYYEKIKEL